MTETNISYTDRYTDGHTDQWTYKQTERLIPVYPQKTFILRGIIRAYIKARSLLSVKPVDIHCEVCYIYGEGQMSHRSVCRWVAKFKACQQDLNDAARSGRPTTTTKSNIRKMSNLLNKIAQYTVRDLAHLMNFSLQQVHGILTHYQTTNFSFFQSERVCRQYFKFDKNGKKLSKRVENTVGKEEIARYEQFLLFPQCFQKACFPGASKGVIVWEWVKKTPET